MSHCFEKGWSRSWWDLHRCWYYGRHCDSAIVTFIMFHISSNWSVLRLSYELVFAYASWSYLAMSSRSTRGSGPGWRVGCSIPSRFHSSLHLRRHRAGFLHHHGYGFDDYCVIAHLARTVFCPLTIWSTVAMIVSSRFTLAARAMMSSLSIQCSHFCQCCSLSREAHFRCWRQNCHRLGDFSTKFAPIAAVN